jgi:Ca2+/Na+ antiporter
MDEMTRRWVMVGITTVVLLAIALIITLTEGINVWSMLMLVAIVALALVAIAMVVKSQREIKSGFPRQDERSIALSMRAGNRAFYVSMYLFLFMGLGLMSLDDQEMLISNAELLLLAVAIMGSIHIVLSAYYNRKGRVPLE